MKVRLRSLSHLETEAAMENQSDQILLSSEDFFSEVVNDAFHQRKIDAYPQVKSYIVGLLEYYMHAKNLYDESQDESGKRKPRTMAELYLEAQQAEHAVKIEMLKKLGDRTLYISGFFADSFSRKIIDVDYYVDIGGTAYGELSYHTREDGLAQVYSVFSKRFMDFVEILSHISQNSFVNNNQNVLQLYDRYLKTGSEVAREKLLELGVITVPRTENLKKII